VSPATWPRDDALDERLLLVDPATGTLRDARVRDLPSMLRAPDLLVVNDGATLPASLQGATAAGDPVEARLFGGDGDGRFRALLFGAGSHRDRTEDRPPPPRLAPGDALRFADDLSAVVDRVDDASPRLADLAFRERGARLWSALYRPGRPVQYAYVTGALELWHTQTRYASRPWCAEAPSAGRPLAWSLLLALLKKGVGVASLTHAAGLSSTGDAALDARLPLAERFEIPEATVRAVAAARAAGGRVVAAGTTVARALEGCVARALEGCAALHGGELVAGEGVTDLVLGRGHRPRVVDGLLTGMHEPDQSHYRLLDLDDLAPDEPVGAHHLRVDRPRDAPARFVEDGRDARVEAVRRGELPAHLLAHGGGELLAHDARSPSSAFQSLAGHDEPAVVPQTCVTVPLAAPLPPAPPRPELRSSTTLPPHAPESASASDIAVHA
jgi:S-adenosylmethionine:tRNA ribosyltransferase-isomerase